MTITQTHDAASSNHDHHIVQAIDRVQAMIEFELDGTIVTANKNFLKTLGYELHEIQGKHHSMFVEPKQVKGQAYKDF